MNSYGKLEHLAARSLDRFPYIRNLVKRAYQRTSYLFFKDNKALSLRQDIYMMSPGQWINQEHVPKEFFFGYYDKSPWSQDMNKMLFHSPGEDGQVQLIVYDKEKSDCKVAGISHAWNYQQGSMLQWLPGGTDKIIFNDVVDKKLVSRIVPLGNEKENLISCPIQAVHPGGGEALTLNYKRLDAIRPEYGYPVAVENYSREQSLDSDGIWKVNLDGDECQLLVSLERLVNHEPRKEMEQANHKTNHIFYSPRGEDFVFMHRWVGPQGKYSRLYVADNSGKDLRLLMDDRMVSHYNWINDEELVVWGRHRQHGDHYYRINIRDHGLKILGEGTLDIYGDGHPSISPQGRWLVTDSYPDKARKRHLLLYDLEHDKLVNLGSFFAPWRYNDAWRCDLHPRWSPDGKWISIDSAHEGFRRSYLLDIAALLG